MMPNNAPLTRRSVFASMAMMAVASVGGRHAGAAPAASGGAATAGDRGAKRILVTGSSGGLGLLAARHLVAQGHRVVVHGRSPERAAEALNEVPGAEAAVHGDFASLRQVRDLADQANRSGRFFAVIHNAAIGSEARRVLTEDGLPQVFAINTLAPFVLTALIDRPRRLVYMSSSMHRGADGAASLDDLLWERRAWRGSTAYSESKLHDMMLAFAIARLWRDVRSNSVDPGWVPTRMGGSGAPDDLDQGSLTQAWLAASDEPAANVTGRHFFHKAPRDTNPDASNPQLQDRLIAACERIAGVKLPG
jgi:NAD(P)-dependent dehydrogenase (short-subunit alcohol dehydrogenase family)